MNRKKKLRTTAKKKQQWLDHENENKALTNNIKKKKEKPLFSNLNYKHQITHCDDQSLISQTTAATEQLFFFLFSERYTRKANIKSKIQKDEATIPHLVFFFLRGGHWGGGGKQFFEGEPKFSGALNLLLSPNFLNNFPPAAGLKSTENIEGALGGGGG